MRYQVVEKTLGMSLFTDIGNSFYTSTEAANFDNILAEVAKKTGNPPGELADNFPYQLTDVLKNPGLLYKNSYSAFGIALNLLTPVGSANMAIAWPFHEPENPLCNRDPNRCFSRQQDEDWWINRFKVEFDIGTEF